MTVATSAGQPDPHHRADDRLIRRRCGPDGHASASGKVGRDVRSRVRRAGHSYPCQGRLGQHPSRPRRCHKGLRPMYSRRRTCADRKHRPRWDRPGRRQFRGLAGAFGGWFAALASDSPWPPPAIYGHLSTSQHFRAGHMGNGSTRDFAAAPQPAPIMPPAGRVRQAITAFGGTEHANGEFRRSGRPGHPLRPGRGRRPCAETLCTTECGASAASSPAVDDDWSQWVRRWPWPGERSPCRRYWRGTLG